MGRVSRGSVDPTRNPGERSTLCSAPGANHKTGNVSAGRGRQGGLREAAGEMEARCGEGKGGTETRTSPAWFALPVAHRERAPRKHLLWCGLSDPRVWHE